MTEGNPFSVAVILPVFRDWECAALLCRNLDAACARMPDVEVRVTIVDDGSPDASSGWESFQPAHLRSIQALWLRRNLGHQRAIAVGLCYLMEHGRCDAVLVMDADGEDRPEDAVSLIEEARKRPGRIVFAARKKRLNGWVFRAGYSLYRILHLALTGIAVRVGNFSVVPFASLNRLCCMSELWNHYAGAVFRSKLPFDCVPIARGERYSGRSQMNWIALVNHGLSGIATFQDVAATRILIANLAAMAAAAIALVCVVLIRLYTNAAIPGWAPYVTGLLLIFMAQLVAASFTLVFLLISNRVSFPFVPIRDYSIFVDRVEVLCGAAIESGRIPIRRQ